MSREQVIERLSPLFEQILAVPAFAPELDMVQVDTWDSLTHIQLLAAIEEAFGLEIGFEDTVDMTSGQAILDKIAKYLPT